MKIAFIKRKTFSKLNGPLRRQLERCFPEFDVEEIDVYRDFLQRRPDVVLRNFVAILGLYGWDILRGRQRISRCFYRTPYLFHAIRRWLRQRLEPRHEEFVFTFATQSLYDASLPGLAHFVYTDQTHLANLYSPLFDRRQLFAQSWIDLEGEIYAHATTIFVPGQQIIRSLCEQYDCPPERTAAMHAGIHFPARPPQLTNDGYRSQTIAFVGADWVRKGGPELIEAFRLVREKLPSAQLLIIGASPRLSLPGVRVLGRRPVAEIPRLLAAASVFCLPSSQEPTGAAVLEAFARQLPAVVTDTGSLPDMVRDGVTGRVVPPGDPVALAAALVDLLSHPDRCHQYGSAARRHFLQNGTWDSVGDRLRAEIARHLDGIWRTQDEPPIWR